MKKWEILEEGLKKLGSEKSGFRGHKGVPGQRGGSAARGIGVVESKLTKTALSKFVVWTTSRYNEYKKSQVVDMAYQMLSGQRTDLEKWVFESGSYTPSSSMGAGSDYLVSATEGYIAKGHYNWGTDKFEEQERIQFTNATKLKPTAKTSEEMLAEIDKVRDTTPKETGLHTFAHQRYPDQREVTPGKPEVGTNGFISEIVRRDDKSIISYVLDQSPDYNGRTLSNKVAYTHAYNSLTRAVSDNLVSSFRISATKSPFGFQEDHIDVISGKLLWHSPIGSFDNYSSTFSSLRSLHSGLEKKAEGI